MILIADSGATSCNWRLINKSGEISQFKTAGFNPYYQDESELESYVNRLSDQIEIDVDHIFYYGAGCGSQANRELIKTILQRSFLKANVEVDDDMLAAARALCGHDSGIACILGTGANSCYYTGESIGQQVSSLGYVLGDEGSGAYLGKTLLADFLRSDMSQKISERFGKRFNLSREQILQKVYFEEAPGRYMAGFTKFILQNIKDPYCFKLVYNAFDAFFERNVLKYSQARTTPVHFSGSVGFYFGNVLRQVANDKGVVLRNIIESPIAGLTLYHKSHFFNE
ncbi:MAG: N-acetylglucosamine kinase [Bacteroidota bacterium]